MQIKNGYGMAPLLERLKRLYLYATTDLP